jgi:hypothetical protein
MGTSTCGALTSRHARLPPRRRLSVTVIFGGTDLSFRTELLFLSEFSCGI